MNRDDTGARDEALLRPLAEAARRVAAEDAGAGPAPAAWHRLRQARDGGPATRRWTLPVIAAAGLALAAGGWLARRPRPLTFVVSGGQVEANGYVLGAGPAATELRFSDGSRVRLERGSRMSVGAPGPRGARLRVEDGQAHFEVVHRPGADWSVEVGPYRVQVTGTVFDVRWSSAEETAAVALRVGSVHITGPHLEAPLALAAGQRLVANLATSAVKLEAGSLDDAPPGERPTGATAPSVPMAPPPQGAPPPRLPHLPATAAHEARPARPAKPVAAPPFAPDQWSRRVAVGEAGVVLAEARAHVFDDVIGGVDAAALAALADAARYSGERGLSARALEELRRRFPASAEAHTAAFQLGRMADDDDDVTGALGWYRRYAEEAPRGPYAAEACGREMLAIERLSGRAAAAPAARAYLARFPEGTYLLQARSILGLP